MTSAAALAAGAPQALNFSCLWSNGYVVAGQPNIGDLELTATGTDQPPPISPGQQLAFLDLPAGWTITPRSSDWQASTVSWRGGSLPALTYVGSAMRFPSFVHVLAPETRTAAAMTGDADSLNIPVAVVVPENVPNLVRVQLQLFGGGAPVSSQSSVLFNSVAPDAPYVAFANAPAVVLVTDPDAIAFPNALDVTLLNLRTTAGADIAATLTLAAFDAGQNPVTISSALDAVEVTGGGAAWTYAPASHAWTATIAEIPAQGMADIAIRQLELDQAAIALLAVTLTLQTSGQTYQTIAWFEAYGPFTMTLALSASVDASKYYRLTEMAGSRYCANTLNPDLNSPPLQPNLVDGGGNVVYPPVPGWYSWTTTSRDFPSNHPLSDGPNTLYYLVSAGETLMPLTTATVDYNFSPEQIFAAGYQQGYGDQPGTNFGPVMPAGAIILWNGAVQQIPAGWALCDGTNGTPNLQSSFVVGAGNSEVPNTSGAASSHNHNFNFSSSFGTSTDGDHAHAMPSGWYSRNLSCGVHTGVDTDGQDVGSSSVQNNGSHSHTVLVSINQNTADVVAPRPAWYALCYIMKL